MSQTAQTPGVLILPPYLVAILGAVGIALHLLVPLDIPAMPWLRWVGGVLVVAGAALAMPAVRLFYRAGTHIPPDRPALVLVKSGPYRFTRNPMYLGMAVGFAGLGLLLGVGWLLVLTPVLVGVLHYGVILREERYLSRRFGAPYDTYRAGTRRWI